MRLITTILTKVSQAYVPTSRSLLYVHNPYFSCKTSVHFSDACLILTNIAYTSKCPVLAAKEGTLISPPTAFAALRIFALYGLKKRVFAMIFCFGILSSCTQIVRLFRQR